MRIRYFILLVLLTAMAGIPTARAEVRVSARVDRTSIMPGESIQLEIRIYDGKGHIDLAPLTDFRVHSRSASTSVQIINGSLTQTVTHNFLLVHLRKGELTIPALTVTVKGKPHRTDPITITVADLAPNGSGDRAKEKEVWVAAEISEDSPFVGQQIIYTFRFFNSTHINDARFNAPDFTGFSSKEIKDQRTYRKVINGREHEITEVYFILTPMDAGTLTIDPAVLHVGIVRRERGRRRSPFDDFFTRSVVEPQMLQTDPVTVQVRQLPPLASSQEFSGLVGRFGITAEMEATDLKVGDSATLTITLEGEGNIMDAQPPSLKIPDAFKSYADNPEEQIRMDRRGARGKKVFRTALVPVETGEYTLPPVQLVYFDVEEENYRTVQAQLPPLTILQATPTQGEPLTVTPGTLPMLKKRVAFTGKDILPPKEGLAAIESHTLMGWPWFVLCLGAPLLLFGCAALAQRMRRPDTSAAAVMRAKSRQALKSAGSQNGESFLSSLYQALTAAIFAASDRTGEAMTWKEAEGLLLEQNFSKEEAAEAANLLSEIESLKFSGAGLGETQARKLLGQTRKMARKLIP